MNIKQAKQEIINTVQAYLTKDYRPLGRLKDRDRFDSDEQYQVHYDAIMESGYANEITDFRVKETSLDKKVSPLMIWIGTALSAVLIIAFNVIMAKRGSEKGYFEFGGSTVILMFEKGAVVPDTDIAKNSREGFETVVRMGERVGIGAASVK